MDEASLTARIKDFALSQERALPFVPASETNVIEAERELGFALPSLLKECYLRVGNGGFGPSHGLIGLRGGSTLSCGSLVETYRAFQGDTESSTQRWPMGLLPFCDWGCACWSCVDCFESDHPVFTCDQGNLWREKYTLQDFFEIWMAGAEFFPSDAFDTIEREGINPFTRQKMVIRTRSRRRTEWDWVTWTDPLAMLRFLDNRADQRRLRLFACACARLSWDKLVDARSRQAVEIGERFADGLCLDAERERLHVSAQVAARAYAAGAETLAAMQAARCASRNFDLTAAQMTPAETIEPEEKRRQCDILRDIFGNPFHFVQINPAWTEWNNSTVLHLARALYNERRFADMPILADALEDAGCRDEPILAHCRQPGLHVRGCWVLDALLR